MWLTIDSAGHRTEIYRPNVPRFALIFLPDLDAVSPRDHADWSSVLEQYGLSLIMPRTDRQWWSHRAPRHGAPASPTAEMILRNDIIPAAVRFLGVPTHPMAIGGVGAGGHDALRIAFRHPQEFPVVAALSADIDHFEMHGRGSELDDLYDRPHACRVDSAPLHLQPGNPPPAIFIACPPDDARFRGNDRLVEKLAALGIPHHADLNTVVCGHSWSYYDALSAGMLRFIAESCARESRRLL